MITRLAALVLTAAISGAGYTLPACAQAPALHLSAEQTAAIVDAYRVGGIRLAAIVLQESSGCLQLTGDGGDAYGCAQLHLDTAEHVVGSRVSAWMLAHDYGLNVRIAAIYLNECTQLYGYKGGITCYHVGIPAARVMTPHALIHSSYLRTIERRMIELKNLPLSTD